MGDSALRHTRALEGMSGRIPEGLAAVSRIRITADRERDVDAIHSWARRLPWWLFLLVSPWLPDYRARHGDAECGTVHHAARKP